ncbi:MAG: fibronectin type III domain-containing protein [Elusimicrobia bacterium]|nr:fibronectin type III domain-containing protein [Elusimicrobiota bacterium]
MQIGRIDHTATLLNTGRVLICGGESAFGTITALCDLFTPNGSTRPGGAVCGAAGGCFDPTSSLLLGRARHTSTLLNDGTVWIAGGWNQTVPSGGWVVTTERYNPATGNWQAAQPLNVARAYHTATAMGDGRVLVVGGFNGRNLKDANGFLTSRGILQTSEIFDPTGGAIVPGPPMQTRIHKHAAVLQADGEVAIYGGFGNIGTTHLNTTVDPVTLSQIAWVSGTASTSSANNYTHIPSTSGAGSINLNFFMDTPATGWIVDGEIDFTSASVTLSGGYADFVTADENNPAVGLRASLQGVYMGCDPQTGKCGQVKTTLPLSLLNMGGPGNQGGYHIASPKDAQNLLTAPTVTGSLTFNSAGGAFIDYANANGTVTNGNITVDARLGLSSLVANWQIKTINCSFNLSDTISWSQQSTYTATLTGGSASVAGPFTAQTSGSVVYIDIPAMNFTGVTGNIIYTGDNGNAPVNSPYAFPAAAVNVMACSLDYTSTGMNIGGGVLKFDSYYALIRNMVSSDYEFYTPSKNQWGFVPDGGGISRPSMPAEGAAAVHLPADDILTIGGRTCGANCGSFIAATSGVGRQDWGLMTDGNNFAAGSAVDNAHAYHSANLLNDGTILIAGGTDGSYVLPYAEIFDPVTQVFVSTGLVMHTARQQHSANLLPNGRVLLAGGFATTAFSTGPTNAAEIYYPDTRLFLNTSVMISSHSQHAAVGLPNGNVFIAGGYDNGTNVTNVAEVYYATSGAWGRLTNMPTNRAIAPAVQLNDGRILICGGINSSGILGSCDAYNPTTDVWNVPAPVSMPTTLQGHTMTLMPDGTVLVAGGNDGFGETNSSYLYDPVGNSWSTVNPLISARFGHSATLLPNGTVMISGGVQQVAPFPGSSANALRTVEFYHPFVAAWSDSSGTLKFNIGARSFHTATLAPDGNVYFFGGANGSIGAGQNTAFYTKYETDYFTSFPDGRGRITPSVRQSTITSTTASPFLPGTNFNATGLRFRGATEGSGGGSASANSSFNYPRLLLQKIDGGGSSAAESSSGFIADLTSEIPLNPANLSTLDTSLTVALPATNAGLPYGWYMTWVGNNDVHSLKAPLVQVGPPKPVAPVTSLAGVTLSTSVISYTWTGGGGADGYSIYSATNGYFLGVQPASAPYFMQMNLLPNTTAGIVVAGYTITGDGPLTASATMYTLPNAPTNLHISSVTFDTLALLWDPNANLPGTIYEVGESSDDFATSFSTPVPSILGLTDTSVTITQLQPNTTYYFRVRAYNSAGLASSWTASVSTLTRTSVSGVAGTALTPNSIQWNWVPAGSVISYKVYNSTSGQLLATTPGNTYLDSGLGIDTPRSISVTAITPAGEGPLSPPSTAYTMAAAPGFVPPGLTGLTTGSFTLQWAPNGNPNGIDYQVLLIDYSSPTVAQLSTATTKAFTYAYGGLFSATQYAVYIYGVNGDGILSTPLVIGSTWTLSRTPSNLTITGTNPISVSAQWNTNQISTNAYYQVNYSSDNFVNDVSTAIALSAKYTGSTVTITSLLTSTTYWLRVMAVNANGQPTPFSNVVATITFNGGAPLGSVAGVVSALNPSVFSGNLGNGRTVQIRSPGGSFPTDTTVIISSYDATVPLCPGGINVAFAIYDTPALQPTSPIFFTASYLPAELGAVPTSRISLQRYDPADKTCVPLKTTFDAASSRFTAQLNHFSLYQLVAVPLATDTGSLRIFPNPYRAATDSYITFDNVPPASRVRVTTLRGETVLDAVADGTGLLTWNASNGAGRSLASGLYLVIVESGGSKKISKLAVVR